MNHKTLSFSLLAHIRMLVANAESFSYCLNLNQQLLKTMGGLDEDQIKATLEDPNNAVLDEKEKAMLLFVLKAVQDPAVTDKKDIDNLHELGWTDSDIFDAFQQGIMMLGFGMGMQAFKMSE